MSTATLPGMADEDLIAARKSLVDRWGFDGEKIRKWTRSRTMTVYHARCKEEAAALNRAEGVAKNIDGDRGKVPGLLRWAAADYLRESLSAGPDAMANALSYAVFSMQDDELKRLTEYTANKFDEGRPRVDRRPGGAGAEAGGDVPPADDGSVLIGDE